MARPLRLRDELADRILDLPGVEMRPSRFGSETLAFAVGTREIAHFHGAREIDLRLTRAVIRRLRGDLEADARVLPGGDALGASDWVAFRFTRRADLGRAAELARLALGANTRAER